MEWAERKHTLPTATHFPLTTGQAALTPRNTPTPDMHNKKKSQSES